jgi:glucose 1-dehydrogenase
LNEENQKMNTAANEKAGILAGQRALVTGANSGIGEQVAKGLAAAGASVVVNYVANEEDTYQVVKDIESSGGKAMAVRADVSREDQVKDMFRKMFMAVGRNR